MHNALPPRTGGVLGGDYYLIFPFERDVKILLVREISRHFVGDATLRLGKRTRRCEHFG